MAIIPYPAISIVTPSFNQAPYLEETIRSVLLQGYPNLEYIIMDGGSTDGSVDIIRKYEPWLTYWTSARDNGQSDAINKGFARATGDIVAWLNSDDVYCPNALTIAAQAMRSHPDLGLVYGNTIVVNGDGETIRMQEVHQLTYDEILRFVTYLPQPAVFLQKKALTATGELCTEYNYAMDYDLWIRVGLHFSFQHIPMFLAKERFHAQAKTSSNPKRSVGEAVRVIERFFDQSLPAEIAGLRDTALGCHYLRMARCCLNVRDTLESRSWARKAVQISPSLSQSIGALKIFLKTVILSGSSCLAGLCRKQKSR